MSTRDYIPAREEQMRAWGVNFDTLLTANPALYGLQAGDAATVHAYVAAFTVALDAAVNPGTRTIATVAAKDGAKAAMLDILRGYAQQVRNNQGVSNANKAALGLTLVDPTPTPVPAPVTAPLLALVAATPGVQTLRFADASTPDKRAKPAGTIGMQLFVAIAATMPAGGPDAARFKAFVTRQPFGVTFDPADKGLTAYYYARWQTRTGLVGPWSAVGAMVIA
jgi:hypothetical protein